MGALRHRCCIPQKKGLTLETSYLYSSSFATYRINYTQTTELRTGIREYPKRVRGTPDSSSGARLHHKESNSKRYYISLDSYLLSAVRERLYIFYVQPKTLTFFLDMDTDI